jgi:hypothetical protein
MAEVYSNRVETDPVKIAVSKIVRGAAVSYVKHGTFDTDVWRNDVRAAIDSALTADRERIIRILVADMDVAVYAERKQKLFKRIRSGYDPANAEKKNHD